MSLPPIPPVFEHLGRRPFSFYPPIRNIAHNEWLFVKATWSELLMVNTKDGSEIWIPRRFIGEVSAIEAPVVIVGLLKELEYEAGAVWPHQRRVIEMPVAVGDIPRPAVAARQQPAPVVGIRLDSRAESRIGRLIIATMTVGVVACLAVITVYRQSQMRPRIVFTLRDQSFLELTPQDDYYSVVRKLGVPQADHWRPQSGEIQYRALAYPERSYIIILMGADQESARYVGAIDKNWRTVLHDVALPRGGSTASLLRGLKRF